MWLGNTIWNKYTDSTAVKFVHVKFETKYRHEKKSLKDDNFTLSWSHSPTRSMQILYIVLLGNIKKYLEDVKLNSIQFLNSIKIFKFFCFIPVDPNNKNICWRFLWFLSSM